MTAPAATTTDLVPSVARALHDDLCAWRGCRTALVPGCSYWTEGWYERRARVAVDAMRKGGE